MSESTSRIRKIPRFFAAALVSSIFCFASIALTGAAAHAAATAKASAVVGPPNSAPPLDAAAETLLAWFRIDRTPPEPTKAGADPPDLAAAWFEASVPGLADLRRSKGSGPRAVARGIGQLKQLRDAIKFLDGKRTAWKGAVKVGLQGDKTRVKSHYEVPSGISIEKGTYPNELRFAAETDAIFDNDSPTKDVASLIANFDHHVSKTVELFAFVERSSDNFMSIERRYEAGIGVRVGSWSGRLRSPAEVRYSGLEEFPADTLRRMLQRETDGSYATSVRQSSAAAFLDSLDIARAAHSDLYRPLFLGIAFGVLQELEQAEVTVQDTLVKKEKSVRLPSERQIRLVVRPTLRWRASRALTVDALWYFKLGERWEDHGDLRVDALTRAGLKLGAESGLKDVGIVVEYRLRRDSNPPRATAERFRDLDVQIGASHFRAQDRHESLKLFLEIGI